MFFNTNSKVEIERVKAAVLRFPSMRGVGRGLLVVDVKDIINDIRGNKEALNN